jgi:hypothetical protein
LAEAMVFTERKEISKLYDCVVKSAYR